MRCFSTCATDNKFSLINKISRESNNILNGKSDSLKKNETYSGFDFFFICMIIYLQTDFQYLSVSSMFSSGQLWADDDDDYELSLLNTEQVLLSTKKTR